MLSSLGHFEIFSMRSRREGLYSTKMVESWNLMVEG